MSVIPEFQQQYSFMEYEMRAKYCTDFPSQDISVFDQQLFCDRTRVDKSQIIPRHFDERRYMSERLTWMKFWPGEQFPGIKPPSYAERSAANNNQVSRQSSYHQYRGGSEGRNSRFERRSEHREGSRGVGGCGGSRGAYHGGGSYVNGENNSPSRGRGNRNRGGGSGRDRRDRYRQASEHWSHSPGPLTSQRSSSQPIRATPSIMDSDNDIISYESDNTTDQQSLVDISETWVPFTVHPTISCRQCGIKGHSELTCSCLINMKQTPDRERLLACGTPGHRAFLYGIEPGCLECVESQSEGSISVQLGVADMVVYDSSGESQDDVAVMDGSYYENTEAPFNTSRQSAAWGSRVSSNNTVTTERYRQVSASAATGATGAKMAASGWEKPESDTAAENGKATTGWDEPEIDAAIRATSQYSANSNYSNYYPVATPFVHHRLQETAPIWETEEADEIDSEPTARYHPAAITRDQRLLASEYNESDDAELDIGKGNVDKDHLLIVF